MKKTLLLLSLLNIGLKAISQNISQDSVLPLIHHMEELPFDTLQKTTSARLIKTIQKAFPVKTGDIQLLGALSRNVKSPNAYFLGRAYLLGRGAFLYENSNYPDLHAAKASGIRQMNKVYILLRKQKVLAPVNFLDILIKLERTGALDTFVINNLDDSLVAQQLKNKALENKVFIKDISKDKQYGYDPDNPIKVGGLAIGPKREKLYLNQLRGPQGELVSYKRIRACCPFKTIHAMAGDSAVLDEFEIVIRGKNKPLLLYINMYDKDTLHCPVGLTISSRK